MVKMQLNVKEPSFEDIVTLIKSVTKSIDMDSNCFIGISKGYSIS